MSETQETIADILAEMHRFAKQHEYDHPDMDTNARGIEDYADRLEAAHGRELEAARREPRTWGECVAEYQKRKEAGEYGPY